MKKIITLLSTLVLMLGIAVSVSVSASAAGSSMANASSISMGTTYSDSITETGREDYYKFTLSSAGRITIDFTSYMEFYSVYIYNNIGEEIWYNGSKQWISTTGMRSDNYNIDLTAGTYSLKVTGHGYYSWEESTGNYNFSVSFSSAKETNVEPNNKIATSSAVKYNSLVYGQMAVNDREDWYSLTVSSASRLKITLTSYMEFYTFYIYNSAGEEIWNNGSKQWISTTGMRSDIYNIDLTAGTYYFKITGHGYYSWEESTGNYNFTVSSKSAKESTKEPNNSATNASPIKLGSSIKGQIAINDREDYYKITLPYNCKIQINITSYLEFYGLHIYDKDGKEIWSSGSKQWVSTTGKRKDSYTIDLSTGIYYLKAHGYGSYSWESATGNYTFSIKEYISVPKLEKVKSTSQTTSSHTIKWGKVAGATGYEVYRYDSSKKKYVKIKTTSSTKYKASKLKSGTTYKYKIRAYIKKNGITYYGAYSSVLSAGTKPAKTTLSSVKSKKSSQLTVAWKAVKGASGYQVYYSTSKKFTSKTTKKATVKKQSTKKTTLKKLKKGKKYYVKVRAYKTVSGKKLYGAFSAVKSAKIKK